MYLQTKMLRFGRKAEFEALQAFRDAVCEVARDRIGECSVSGEIAALDAIRFEFMSTEGLKPEGASAFQDVVWNMAVANPKYGPSVELERLETHLPPPGPVPA